MRDSGEAKELISGPNCPWDSSEAKGSPRAFQGRWRTSPHEPHNELADLRMQLRHLRLTADLRIRSVVVEHLSQLIDSLPFPLRDLVRVQLVLRRQLRIVRSPRIASSAIFALNSAENRLRVFIVNCPFHKGRSTLCPWSQVTASKTSPAITPHRWVLRLEERAARASPKTIRTSSPMRWPAVAQKR